MRPMEFGLTLPALLKVPPRTKHYTSSLPHTQSKYLHHIARREVLRAFGDAQQGVGARGCGEPVGAGDRIGIHPQAAVGLAVDAPALELETRVVLVQRCTEPRVQCGDRKSTRLNSRH